MGNPPVEEHRRPTTDYQIVSPTYFSTLELPIVAGRAFPDTDTADGTLVCIVNEGFVRRHLQGGSVIGERIAVRAPTSGRIQVRQIVGVARQVKGRPDEVEDFVQLYVPLAQDPSTTSSCSFDPGRFRLRAGVVGPSRDRARGHGATGDRWAAGHAGRHRIRGNGRQRFRAWLVMAFAGLALMLAMVGVFGIIAYSVQQRMREFGVQDCAWSEHRHDTRARSSRCSTHGWRRRLARARRGGAAVAIDLGVPVRRAATRSGDVRERGFGAGPDGGRGRAHARAARGACWNPVVAFRNPVVSAFRRPCRSG